MPGQALGRAFLIDVKPSEPVPSFGVGWGRSKMSKMFCWKDLLHPSITCANQHWASWCCRFVQYRLLLLQDFFYTLEAEKLKFQILKSHFSPFDQRDFRSVTTCGSQSWRRQTSQIVYTISHPKVSFMSSAFQRESVVLRSRTKAFWRRSARSRRPAKWALEAPPSHEVEQWRGFEKWTSKLKAILPFHFSKEVFLVLLWESVVCSSVRWVCLLVWSPTHRRYAHDGFATWTTRGGAKSSAFGVLIQCRFHAILVMFVAYLVFMTSRMRWWEAKKEDVFMHFFWSLKDSRWTFSLKKHFCISCT